MTRQPNCPSYQLGVSHTQRDADTALTWHGATHSPTKTAAASPPSILQQTHRGAMISLFPSGRTRPDRHFARHRAVTPSPGHGHVLTDTDSLRHSQASGAPLLFWPTRKSPRQATPPPRHREQQHGDWRGTRKQMATPGGNDRFGSGDGRKMPRGDGAQRRPLDCEELLFWRIKRQ